MDDPDFDVGPPPVDPVVWMLLVIVASLFAGALVGAIHFVVEG